MIADYYGNAYLSLFRYVMLGANESRCLHDGTWSHPPPLCKGNTSYSDPANFVSAFKKAQTEQSGLTRSYKTISSVTEKQGSVFKSTTNLEPTSGKLLKN